MASGVAEKVAVGEKQPGAVWGSGELLSSHGGAPEGRDTEGASARWSRAGAAGPVQHLAANHDVLALRPLDIVLFCRQCSGLLLGALGEAVGSTGTSLCCWQGQAAPVATHTQGTEQAVAWVAAGNECLKRDFVPPRLVT